MDIIPADIIRLQQEAGQVENELRLRAIIAERRIRELEAQIAALQAMPAMEDARRVAPRWVPEPKEGTASSL